MKMAQVKVSFFGARFISRAAKAENSDFLGLSLLRNQTETLATQAISTVNHDPFSYIVRGQCSHQDFALGSPRAPSSEK